jgi:2-polyprenyl-6-methoxyphenol hydroxylase-like FAD-dependent oxidoreductase
MPQWDFLNFVAGQGRRYPGFHLRMECEAVDLIEEEGRVAGVRCRTPQGADEVRAGLTIGADGRRSLVRAKAGLESVDLGAPIDVLWMRIGREPGDGPATLGRVRAGRILVTLDRGDYWQCAYVIAKGGFDEIRKRGLPSFRADIVKIAPFLAGRVNELKDWSDISLLSVAVDRLRQWWRSGLLCIGEAAHAMSPVGGVGINLAIQDAVAAANILAGPLLAGSVTDAHLKAVQRRRTFPTRMTQAFQVLAHKRVIRPTLEKQTTLKRLPFPIKLLQWFPALRRVPARLIGIGFRPEHVRTADTIS